MPERLVNIAFPASALRKFYTYKIHSAYDGDIFPGQRVVAPLRNIPTIGFVAEVGVSAPDNIRLKTIAEIIDPEPLIPQELFRFLIKLSNYYLSPLGKTLSAAIPKEYHVQKKRKLSVTDPDPTGIPERYLEIFTTLSGKTAVSLSSLKRRFEKNVLIRGIEELKKLGKITETPDFQLPQQKGSVHRQIHLSDISENQSADLASLPTRAPRQWEIIEYLQTHPTIPQSHFHQFSASGIKALLEKGLITLTETETEDSTYWDDFQIKEKSITLTYEQQQVVDQISKDISEHRFAPFLLQGVTGSGKTEVYLRLINAALKTGKSTLVLVPEITLTTHLAGRFRGEFKEKIAIWHSQLSVSQRNHLWNKIRNGNYPVVIGARSALLLPFENLGLIIIDEEQDNSYKQREQDPRYHARDAALMRGVENKAVVVMGSATPSLESLYNAATGKFTKLELLKRYSSAPSANIEIIDMKAEWQSTGDFQNPLSRILTKKIAEKLERGEQILLLQNRRGYSSVLLCPDCGWTPSCRNCDISLTYHKSDQLMRCHYCNSSQRPPDICPNCQSNKFLFPGFGTQRVESCLNDLFPNHKIVRLDVDSSRKAGHLQRTMRDFESGKIDIILGTQMIAKGLDFPNVTLVGVLNADIGLFMPDFRARERVFHLLYQVAGRAGRGSKQGEVYIQSFNPQDVTIRFAMQQNIDQFIALELNERNPINYPPFSRLAALLFSGLNEAQVEKAAAVCTKALKSQRHKLEILGPSPAPLKKIKNRYRYLAIIKSRKESDPNGSRLRSTLRNFIDSQVYRTQSRNVRINIDIDPLDLM